MNAEEQAVLDAWRKQKAAKQAQAQKGQPARRGFGSSEFAALVIFGGLALMVVIYGLELAGVI